MGDENPIRTLGDYSKPSHESYWNTIDLLVGNNVVPLRSDTICMDSFQGLTTKVPHHGIDRWLQIQIFYDHVSFHLKCEIDRTVSGKLCNKNADESWEIIDLALYDHEGLNDTKEFAKSVKAISKPQGTSKTPDRRLLDLEDQINFLLKGKFTTNQEPNNINEATNTWKDKPNFNWERAQTFTSPHNGSILTHSSNYQMKLEKELDDLDSHKEKRLSSLRTQLGQQQDDMIGKINLLWKTVSEKLNDAPIPESTKNSMDSKNIC
nr:hypothetical protein [Tanacetum cinerariifolium]